MIITVVISMLSAFICQTILFFCSKGATSKPKNGASPLAQSPGASSSASSNAVTPGQKATVVDRDENDSTRTKAGNRNKSMMKEPDSVDDAYKEMAAKLAKKAKEKTVADSLMGDDDENPMANFCMPERPVVDNKKQDGAKLANIIEMEKKPKGKTPVAVPPTPSASPAAPAPSAIGNAGPPPQTAKDRSVAKTVTSKKSEKPPVAKKNSKKGSKIESKKSRMSKIETAETLVVDKTQSGPEAKPDVDVTQEEKASVEEEEVKKQQPTAMSTMKNATVMLTVKKNSIMKEPK